MASLSLADLAGSAAGGGIGGGSLGEALRSATDVKRVAAFDDAMGRTTVDPSRVAADPSRVAASETGSTAPATAPAVQDSSAASRERVRRTLDLEGVAARPSEGDAILGGLQRLRGTLDARHTRIGALLEGNSVDTNALISVQMEVAQYTLLVDVSSKLTGKATSSLDTLMKGQ